MGRIGQRLILGSARCQVAYDFRGEFMGHPLYVFNGAHGQGARYHHDADAGRPW